VVDAGASTASDAENRCSLYNGIASSCIRAIEPIIAIAIHRFRLPLFEAAAGDGNQRSAGRKFEGLVDIIWRSGFGTLF
jgi:hypothetical protein